MSGTTWRVNGAVDGSTSNCTASVTGSIMTVNNGSSLSGPPYSPDEPRRIFVSFPSSGVALARAGARTVTGDAGSGTGPVALRLKSSASFSIGAFAYLYRLLALGAVPTAAALQAADDWVQQTFQGRIRT
jgi:hypothetical protein